MLLKWSCSYTEPVRYAVINPALTQVFSSAAEDRPASLQDPKACRDHSQISSYQKISFLCTLCTSKDGGSARLFPQLTTFSALKMCWDSSGFFISSFPSMLTPNPVFLWGLKVSQTLGEAEGVCYRMVCAHTGHVSQVNGKPSVTDLGLPKHTPQPSHLNLFAKSSASCFIAPLLFPLGESLFFHSILCTSNPFDKLSSRSCGSL